MCRSDTNGALSNYRWMLANSGASAVFVAADAPPYGRYLARVGCSQSTAFVVLIE